MIENLWIPPVGMIVHYTLPEYGPGEVRPAIVVRHMGANVLALAVQYYGGDVQAGLGSITINVPHSTKYAPGCWTPTPWAAPNGAGRCLVVNHARTSCQLAIGHHGDIPNEQLFDACLFGEPLTGP